MLHLPRRLPPLDAILALPARPGNHIRRSLQLIEGQPEARQEGLEEIAHLGQFERFHGRPERALGLGKFRVARAHLLDTLDVRAQLVGGTDQLEVDPIVGIGAEERLVGAAERLGQHREEARLRRRLDVAVRMVDLRVEGLHRRRQVAGEHLAGVVIEREGGHACRVDIAAEQAVADDRQRVGDLRHPQAVLLHVLRVRAVHEAPPADELHPREVREEVAHRGASPAGAGFAGASAPDRTPPGSWRSWMKRLTAGVSGFCRRWMMPTGRLSSGAPKVISVSARMPASFSTVWRGRMLTPASIMIACLIVSMLSNSMTTFGRALCWRRARSMALRMVSPRSKATNGSPLRSAAVTLRRLARRWPGWQTKAMGSSRRATTLSARSDGG